MNKSELLSTYTAEQLADKYLNLQDKFNVKLHKEVEKFQAYSAKNQKEIKARQGEIEKLKKENDELKAENAELHCETQAMMIFPDEFPEEPIKIADILISATHTREKSLMEKTFSKAAFGNNDDTIAENMYSISELRQIAEHLLVYCNANGEMEE